MKTLEHFSYLASINHCIHVTWQCAKERLVQRQWSFLITIKNLTFSLDLLYDQHLCDSWVYPYETKLIQSSLSSLSAHIESSNVIFTNLWHTLDMQEILYALRIIQFTKYYLRIYDTFCAWFEFMGQSGGNQSSHRRNMQTRHGKFSKGLKIEPVTQLSHLAAISSSLQRKLSLISWTWTEPTHCRMNTTLCPSVIVCHDQTGLFKHMGVSFFLCLNKVTASVIYQTYRTELSDYEFT